MKLPQATLSLRGPGQHSIKSRGSLDAPPGGLVFDTGDVLYDATVWRRWLLKMLSRLGLHTNYRSFYRLWDRDYLVDVHCGRREYWEAFRSFLSSAGLSHGQIEEVEVACRAERAERLAAVRLFPGVRRTLRRLRDGGVPLAAIADSELCREAAEEQLRRVGLEGVFNVVICSRDLGHAKPHRACYVAALAGLGLATDKAAFVGHDGDELAAAAHVGMRTIAFNFDRQAQADVYLCRFDELVDLVLVPSRLAVAG